MNRTPPPTPLRILLTADWFYPSPVSGPGNAGYWLAKALTRAGHVVTVVATAQDLPASVPRNRWLTRDFGRVIYTTNLHVYWPVRHLWTGFRAMRQVDVVHVNSLFYPGSAGLVLLARLLGRAVVWSPHGELSPVALAFSPRRKRLLLPALRWLARRVVFHATSRAEAAQIQQQFGRNGGIVEVMNRMELPAQQARTARPYLLFVGRLHPIKALNQLLDALAQSDLFRAGPYTLVLAGPDQHGYAQTLREQVQRLGLSTKVHFIGTVEGNTKTRLFANALVTILPSHSENFGIVVIESLAQGTPVIAATGTPWQQLESEQAGHWTANDPAALRRTIETYLTMTPDLYQTYRKRAYRLAHSQFDTYKGVGEWERLYASALAGKRHKSRLATAPNAVAFHDEQARAFAERYTTSAAFRDRFRVWTELFAQYVRPTNTVLDLGCGSGIFCRHLTEAGCTVTGVDGSAAMIALCNEQNAWPTVRFVKALLPLTNPASFAPVDVILLSSVLEYMDDLPGMLRQTHTLLNPGGLLFISMPNQQSLYRVLEHTLFRLTGKPAYYAHVQHVVTARDFGREVAKAGFESVDLVYFARADPVSRLLKWLLPPHLVNTLFVGVYQKRSTPDKPNP